MAGEQMNSAATLLLLLNFCMYVIILGFGGWSINKAIDHGFIIGSGFDLPAHFSPIYFPMGNAATGFFVTFSLIAGVVGIASVIAGLGHVRLWSHESLPGAASAATIAWSLTLLAMGFACKEIQLEVRNARLVSKIHTFSSFTLNSPNSELAENGYYLISQRTMEAFIIILSATQLLYIAVIHGAVTHRR